MQSALTIVTTWPRFWDRFPVSVDALAVRTLVNAIEARDRYMLAALTNVRVSKGLHAARRLQRRYLLSASSKLAALSRAWQARKKIPLAQLTDTDMMELFKIAGSLFAWKAAPEQALAFPKMKRDGENYRMLHKFRLRQRALDEMAANAGRTLTDLLPTQFNQRGKGIKKFDEWLWARMPTIQIVVTVDIPSCFDVIRRSSMEGSLLLPKPVVEAAMLKPMDRAKHLTGVHTGILTKNTHDVETSAARRGVPQGSALAQLASDIEIDKVLRAVASVHGTVHVAAFGDNLIFLLEDAGWLGSVNAALTKAVTKQFGSDVTTALVERIRYDKPASFGYCRRTYSWKKGKLKKALPDGYVDDFVVRTTLKLQDAYAAKDNLALDSCEASITGFFHAHTGEKGIFVECAALWSDVKERRDLLKKKMGPDGP